GDHVELDEVDVAANRRFERPDRVLGLERRRATVADPEDTIVLASSKLGQPVRLITTTAQSSVSPPPARSRQAATIASASSSAGSMARDATAASRRSSP